MSIDLTQHLTEFQQQGVTCFPQQLDPTTVAQWQSVFQNQLADPPPNGNRRDTYQLIQKYPQLALPFVANAQVLDFLEILMGPFVSLEALAISATFPTPKARADSGIHWHRDMWAQVGRTTDYLPPNAVNVLNYFPHLQPAHGAFRYIPGSHRQSVFAIGDQAGKPHPQEQLLYPKMGDTMFIHSGLLHSGTGNSSHEMRYFISRFYAKCWYPRREETDILPIQSFVADAELQRDRRLMRLFGQDDLLLSRAGRSGSQLESETWQQWIAEDRRYKLTGEE